MTTVPQIFRRGGIPFREKGADNMFNLLNGSFTNEDLMTFLVRTMIILLVLPLHEYAHAWMAYKLGDDTASYQGRLTLNPLAHLDPIGSILLLLTGFGWAKPVPIDPLRFNRKHSIRFGVAITALAGPVSNLIAAYIGMIGYRFYIQSSYYLSSFDAESAVAAPQLIFYALSSFVWINLGLAVFNLLPIPPLDGSRVLNYFVSANVERWVSRNYQVIRIVFLAVLLTGVLSLPMYWIETLLYRLFVFLTGWVDLIAARIG